MEHIILKAPFTCFGGYAFEYSLASAKICYGDTCDFPKASYAYLLEDGKPLGPAHALHYKIRENGMGCFSHWGEHVYFSTSDNSDPNTNGRTYTLNVPTQEEIACQKRILIDSSGADPGLCYNFIKSAMNTNGSPFVSYLSSFQNYKNVLSRYGVNISDKNILEIGSGPNPGTALSFLLHGAAHVYANDIGSVRQIFPLEYALLIRFLAEASKQSQPKPLEDCLLTVTGQTENTGINPALYSALPLIPAEDVELPDNSLDLIVSMSVLEHVKNVKGVLSNCFRILKPGGHCLHFIDLKDHVNPTKPLAFLSIPREQYEPDGTENRLRASDFISEFSAAGFDITATLLQDTVVPVATDGNMDVMGYYMSGDMATAYNKTSLDQVVPWVTAEMRSSFTEEFKQKSFEDLSVTGIVILATKPI